MTVFLNRVLAEPLGKYAPVNGLKLYYELHGTTNDVKRPLVLLHGGVGAIEMFGSILETSQLAILPGLTHYTIFSSSAPTAAVIPFLDKADTEVKKVKRGE